MDWRVMRLLVVICVRLLRSREACVVGRPVWKAVTVRRIYVTEKQSVSLSFSINFGPGDERTRKRSCRPLGSVRKGFPLDEEDS